MSKNEALFEALLLRPGLQRKRWAFPAAGATRRRRAKAGSYPAIAGTASMNNSVIAEVASQAFIGITLEGVVRAWCPHATRMLGVTADEIFGNSVFNLLGTAKRKEQEDLLRRARSGWAAGPIKIAPRMEFAVVPLQDAEGRVASLVGVFRETSAPRPQEMQRALMVDELNHRVKNTLATVQSIFVQTLRGAESLNAFGVTFGARLASLAITHSLLTKGGWKGSALSDLLESELAPYAGSATPRWTGAGPAVVLNPAQAIPFGMLVHELATNAAKYGAFSSTGGHVDIDWLVLRTDDGSRRLKLRWVERGGPPVETPTRRGFGTRLMTEGLALEFDGDVTLSFGRSGVRCEIDIPLDTPGDGI